MMNLSLPLITTKLAMGLQESPPSTQPEGSDDPSIPPESADQYEEVETPIRRLKLRKGPPTLKDLLNEGPYRGRGKQDFNLDQGKIVSVTLPSGIRIDFDAESKKYSFFGSPGEDKGRDNISLVFFNSRLFLQDFSNAPESIYTIDLGRRFDTYHHGDFNKAIGSFRDLDVTVTDWLDIGENMQMKYDSHKRELFLENVPENFSPRFVQPKQPPEDQDKDPRYFLVFDVFDPDTGDLRREQTIIFELKELFDIRAPSSPDYEISLIVGYQDPPN